MNNDIFSLIDAAKEQMKQIGLADATIETYQQRSFNQIIQRYQKEGDYQYRQEIMYELLMDAEQQFSDGVISRKSRNWRRRGIKVLQEFFQSGSFQWKVYQKSSSDQLPDLFEETISSFMESFLLSRRYTTEIRSIVIRFCIFLEKREIRCFQEVSPEDLREFLHLMHESRPKSMDKVVSSLRKLFTFLNDNGTITANFRLLLSSPRTRDHSVKPTMPRTELIAMTNQIDRTKNPGKRDFAIFSLAATTGLRAGDLASLQLSDIFWRENELRIVQGKTGHQLMLPLQSSARDALADYILNERPQSSSKNVFLRTCAPYAPFRDGVSIASIFRRYLEKAGIQHQFNDGKTFHGIRRLLGTTMVSEGTPVTTVAQILGHQAISSTRQYIAMDLNGLQKCALPLSSIGGEV